MSWSGRPVTRPKSNCGLCSATNYYRQNRNTSPEPGPELEAGLGSSTILQMTRAQFTTLQQTQRPGQKSSPTTNPTLGSIFAASGPETGATDIIPSEYEVELATKVIPRLPNISRSRKRPLTVHLGLSRHLAVPTLQTKLPNQTCMILWRHYSQ